MIDLYPTHDGSKFSGWRRASDIARDIRADIKAAQKAGDLPTDLKVSVRSRSYAGGQAVDVTLSGWERDRIWTDRADWSGYTYRGLTDEADAVCHRIEEMRGAYNRSRTNSMIDYFDETYYGRTSWDWQTDRD